MLLPQIGLAQLTPDREYYGVDRPIPMQARVPEGAKGEVRIDLHEPGIEKPLTSAPALSGPVDLAAMFPALWKNPSHPVRFAQLVVGGEEIGPPVVLQPMTTPAQAKLVHPQSRQVYFKDPAAAANAENYAPQEGKIEWVTTPPVYAGVRAWVDKHVIFETSLGEIEFRTRPDAAPNTVRNFLDLVEGGFYTDIIFHRVVATRPNGTAFVVQVGDPTGTGDGGPGYNLPLEPSTLAHDFGVLSMARDTDPDTAGSQVFVALSREGTSHLDGRYTAFAQTVRGGDAIIAIARVPVKNERPNDPPVLKTARTIDAPPWSKRSPAASRPKEAPKGR
jgi:peptidyl-prolyl cis-trans isomerase B (cyclophilin B)